MNREEMKEGIVSRNLRPLAPKMVQLRWYKKLPGSRREKVLSTPSKIGHYGGRTLDGIVNSVKEKYPKLIANVLQNTSSSTCLEVHTLRFREAEPFKRIE